MSQSVSETVSSALSLNISGTVGTGFITMQPQIVPVKPPLAGVNIYSDGNNNICWKPAQGSVFTFNTVSTTASRTWTLPDSSSELATVDSLAAKENKSAKGLPDGYPSLDENGKVPLEQLPSAVSGFAPSVISVLYATTIIVPGATPQIEALTTIPPLVFSSLAGYEPAANSKMTVDLASGEFIMDTLGSVYEFKIDTQWPEFAETGERRLISFIPMNGDLEQDQVTHREELGLISSSHGQTISCDPFVYVNSLGASGGFTAGIELSASGATTARTVYVRIRVIRWA